MEKLVLLGIVVLGTVWYFKSKKNKSQNVKDVTKSGGQEESTESTESRPNDLKETSNEVEDTKIVDEVKDEEVDYNLEVVIANLPAIIEGKAPVDYTLENLKELAKDIFSKQVEPLSYATIYKYIADHYGHRNWKDFKKILESK